MLPAPIIGANIKTTVTTKNKKHKEMNQRNRGIRLPKTKTIQMMKNEVHIKISHIIGRQETTIINTGTETESHE